MKTIVPPHQGERQQDDVDPTSKILFYIMVILIAISIIHTFWSTIVQDNFDIVNDIESEEVSDFEIL